MEYDIQDLLSHISTMANEAIDLEDFQSSLEEFASDLELALEEDDHKRGLSTGAKIGLGLGAVGAASVASGMYVKSFVHTVERVGRADPAFAEWLRDAVLLHNSHTLKPAEARKIAAKIDSRVEYLHRKGHINERDVERLKKLSKKIVRVAEKSFR